MAVNFIFALYVGCASHGQDSHINAGKPLMLAKMEYDSSVIEIGNLHTCGNIQSFGRSKMLCDSSMLKDAFLGRPCVFQNSKVLYSVYRGWKTFCIDLYGCGENSNLYNLGLLDSLFQVLPRDTCVKVMF